jgi:hypothetical protein
MLMFTTYDPTPADSLKFHSLRKHLRSLCSCPKDFIEQLVQYVNIYTVRAALIESDALAPDVIRAPPIF